MLTIYKATIVARKQKCLGSTALPRHFRCVVKIALPPLSPGRERRTDFMLASGIGSPLPGEGSGVGLKLSPT